MKTTLVGLFAILLIVTTAGLAGATEFQISDLSSLTFSFSPNVTYSVYNGVMVNTGENVTPGHTSLPFDLFTVTGLKVPSDTYSVDLNVVFTSPAGTTTGDTGTADLTFHKVLTSTFDTGSLQWTNDSYTGLLGAKYAKILFNYGNGGEADLNLYDSIITGGDTIVFASITNLKDPVATPEPASLFLVAGALFGCGLICRQRRMARHRPS